ncbi:coenzyme F420-0:L-glutamate ligase [Aquamicrobium sp. LC103]|uniref:coenzyme F420-0:L-glutamate ligase n=1 Tax=Aquamicrobium sp. LC103 TaxID=1120658 RepID=UPI00063EB0E2|nr:coenzyme F420-0:L-glutamate ligase [Aquamicrobium sp. LC103]TKT74513.1 coenzyme F420-0:L-glutamate ligase [Aquamicrobium sp. LC103]
MASRTPLVITPLPDMPAVSEGDDLTRLILTGLEASGIAITDGDVIAMAQKIVSKAEGRAVRLADVTPSRRARELAATAQKDPRLVELILGESVEVLRCRPGVIIVEDRRGFVMANAGIDASNVTVDGETVLLLPENPDASAEGLRDDLQARTGVNIGIVIIDSFGRAWRLGTTGTAIGVAGVPGLIDMRGHPDMNGRPLLTTELGVADELAAAASLVMGQADERTPVVHMRGFPYPLCKGSARELVRARTMDLFR